MLGCESHRFQNRFFINLLPKWKLPFEMQNSQVEKENRKY